MMGDYSGHDPACYVVSWADNSIVKVGYTAHQRYRKFLLRGGVILGLWTFHDHMIAFDLESHLQSALHQSGYGPAFNDRASAAHYLGGGGSGWMECYTVPAGADPMADVESGCAEFMREQCSDAMRSHDADALLRRYASR